MVTKAYIIVISVNGRRRSCRVGIWREVTVPNALNINRFATGNTKVMTNMNPANMNTFPEGISKNLGMDKPSNNTR